MKIKQVFETNKLPDDMEHILYSVRGKWYSGKFQFSRSPNGYGHIVYSDDGMAIWDTQVDEWMKGVDDE